MKITTRTSSLFILLLQYLLQTSVAKPHCTPSACGVVPTITSPLRLKGDPNHCGDGRLELVCENNVAAFYLNSHKYYVKQIDYTARTFRLVDSSIDNHTCSFPNNSAYDHDFTLHPYLYLLSPYSDSLSVNFISCSHPLSTSSSSTYTDASYCYSSESRFTYIKVGHVHASEVPETCRIDVIAMTSFEFNDSNNVSLQEIHDSLLYGFQLGFCPDCMAAWRQSLREKFIGFFIGAGVFLLIPLAIVGVSLPVMIIVGFSCGLLLLLTSFQWIPDWTSSFGPLLPRNTMYSRPFIYHGSIPGFISIMIICVPRFIICPFVVWILICKFRTRHLSMFDAIESFLQSDNKLVPIRYSYSEINKMTKGFQDKLGEGGYGFVYKGKLRSGHDVAVKLLGKSGGNGQDFTNEISTIGRIHHVNIVKLVGYCAQGNKRALVFDFMPNGSLEKYIFDPEKLDSLNWDTKFDIAIGVARGIEYLHRGCDVQILHFDIKPHNILLDDKFVPKISDFGLAKFCSAEKNAVTLTAARGTIGYVAPELINRGLGRASFKADVYSFGMLLMDIVSLKRESSKSDDSSSKYFPYWIYDYFNQGKDIETEKLDDGDTRKLARKMTIVALWCIRMSPDDRPSMSKVLEMLEGDVERLQLPQHPSQSTQILINEDQVGITCSSDSTSMVHHDNDLSHVEITIQE